MVGLAVAFTIWFHIRLAITVHKSGKKVDMFLWNVRNSIYVADKQQADMFRRAPHWFILTSVHYCYIELQRTLTHCVWVRSHCGVIQVSPPIQYLCIRTRCPAWVTLLSELTCCLLASALLRQHCNGNGIWKVNWNTLHQGRPHIAHWWYIHKWFK